jgi:hypothetical protein
MYCGQPYAIKLLVAPLLASFDRAQDSFSHPQLLNNSLVETIRADMPTPRKAVHMPVMAAGPYQPYPVEWHAKGEEPVGPCDLDLNLCLA